MVRQSVSYLLLGYLFVPLSYFLFTKYSEPRLRCHIPSTHQFDHLFYELAPILFVLLALFLSWRLCIRALLAHQGLAISLLVVGFAFWFSIFTFALVYYSFGLELRPTMDQLQYLDLVVDLDREEALTPIPHEVDVHQHGVYFGEQQYAFGATSFAPNITRSGLDYLIYSASAMLPGVPSNDSLQICEWAKVFKWIQSFAGIVLGLIAIIIAVRVQSAIEKGSSEPGGNPVRDPGNVVAPRVVHVVRGHEPDVFDIDRLARQRHGARRKNLRSVGARNRRKPGPD